MEWNIKRGRIYTSKQGTARAHLYYWVRHNDTRNFTAGYYGFGREITFTNNGAPKQFSTIGEAKRHCEKIDHEAVIISEVSA